MPVDIVLQLHVVCFSTTVSATTNDTSPPSECLTRRGDTADSALQRCSLLSRFLI